MTQFGFNEKIYRIYAVSQPTLGLGFIEKSLVGI